MSGEGQGKGAYKGRRQADQTDQAPCMPGGGIPSCRFANPRWTFFVGPQVVVETSTTLIVEIIALIVKIKP